MQLKYAQPHRLSGFKAMPVRLTVMGRSSTDALQHAMMSVVQPPPLLSPTGQVITKFGREGIPVIVSFEVDTPILA